MLSFLASGAISAHAVPQQTNYFSQRIMIVHQTGIEGVAVIEPQVFGDERGFFLESYQEERYRAALGTPLRFVQDNHSHSAKGVLRGLHVQSGTPQGKLVRCVTGAVFDVAVDIRKESPTYGEWFGLELSAENKKQLWIAPGLAHGFLVLSEYADFEYKCTDYYDPKSERSLHWNDLTVAVQWPTLDCPYQLSAKDQAGESLCAVAH